MPFGKMKVNGKFEMLYTIIEQHIYEVQMRVD